MENKRINVIGAGLAGSEAAYQIAKRGYEVNLYEIRPNAKAKAHHSGLFGELVCSNSLKSFDLCNAAGLLKEEMRSLDSLIIKCADATKVPAGMALAVDRDKFAQMITNEINNMPNIHVINQEVTSLNDDEIYVIATGPLTTEDFSNYLSKLLGNDYLYFYDAAAPLILKDGINFDIAYYKSRYDKSEGSDYINCPMTKEQFFVFYNELVHAQRVELHAFEKEIHFEGCMPIESMGERGPKTITFGPLKPVGLERPDGTRPYAVVQLRQDNSEGTMYNLVGFQTNLLFKEQDRVFKLIPGLEKATFVRYGVMHRNTYLCSPKLLNKTLNLKQNPNIFFAGQIIGVEGYIESAASGIIAGINATKQFEGNAIVCPPRETVLGALLDYIANANPVNFQPMNANYGVLASLLSDKKAIAELSLSKLKEWKDTNA